MVISASSDVTSFLWNEVQFNFTKAYYLLTSPREIHSLNFYYKSMYNKNFENSILRYSLRYVFIVYRLIGATLIENFFQVPFFFLNRNFNNTVINIPARQ